METAGQLPFISDPLAAPLAHGEGDQAFVLSTMLVEINVQADPEEPCNGNIVFKF